MIVDRCILFALGEIFSSPWVPFSVRRSPHKMHVPSLFVVFRRTNTGISPIKQAQSPENGGGRASLGGGRNGAGGAMGAGLGGRPSLPRPGQVGAGTCTVFCLLVFLGFDDLTKDTVASFRVECSRKKVVFGQNSSHLAPTFKKSPTSVLRQRAKHFTAPLKGPPREDLGRLPMSSDRVSSARE